MQRVVPYDYSSPPETFSYTYAESCGYDYSPPPSETFSYMYAESCGL